MRWCLLVLLAQAALALTPRQEALHKHAVEMPRGAERNITAVAAYLVKPCRDPEEKAWVLYCWVADRVAYDTRAYFSGTIPSQDAEVVFKTRLSVCAGYGELYAALGKAAGLEVQVVTGWGKGFGFLRRQTLDEQMGHAWNAVKTGRGWILLDATWGSGSVGDDQKFAKAFDPYWFKTPPRWFAYSHWPRETRFQLLEKPLSEVEFRAEPCLAAAYFEYGLRALQSLRAAYQADPELVLRFDIPVNVRVSGGLEGLQNYVLCEREGNSLKVSVRAPKPGNYKLQLYAGLEEDRERAGAAQFDLRCKRSTNQPFPFAWTSDIQVVTPRNGVLPPGPTAFQLRIPGAKEVTVEGQKLIRKGDEFTGTVNLKRGKLFVFAGSSSILQYEVR